MAHYSLCKMEGWGAIFRGSMSESVSTPMPPKASRSVQCLSATLGVKPTASPQDLAHPFTLSSPPPLQPLATQAADLSPL